MLLFNSALLLRNFFINWASNVVKVLLKTYNHHRTVTNFSNYICAHVYAYGRIYVIYFSFSVSFST